MDTPAPRVADSPSESPSGVPLDLGRLAESAELGRALIDRLPGAGLIVVDRNLRVLLLEGDAYRTYDRETAVGRTLPEIMPASAWSVLTPHYRAALAGRTQSFEYHSSDGARVWAVRMSAIRDTAAGAAVAGVMVLVEEVTARSKAEELIHAGERLQQSIVEVLSEGVVVVGLDGELVQANEAARTLLGHPLDPTARDRRWWDRLEAEHPGGTAFRLRAPGEDVLRAGTEGREVRITVRRGDGSRRTLRLNYATLPGPGEHPRGLVLSFHDVTEKEQEHERLLATESRLRDAHELASLASWELDLQRDHVTISHALSAAAPELPEGSGLETLLKGVPAEDVETVTRSLVEMRSGRVEHQLLRYRYLIGGECVWVETRARAVRDAAGELVAVRGTTQDVTAQHRAAGRLYEAHEFLQATMDSLAGHVAVLDERGEIVAVNAAWERFALHNGGDPDRLGVGTNYLAACDAAAGDPYAERVAAALRAILDGSADSFELEYPCDAPDQPRWFVLRADPHRSMGPTRIVIQHTDVTVLRQAEQAARMRARLLDEVDAAVIATDVEGRVTEWNAGATTLYGWTPEETLGRPITDVTAGEPEERAVGRILDALRRDGRWEGQIDARRKDGTTFPAHVRNTALVDEGGRRTGLVGVSVDVSDRVRGERELRSARDYLRAVTDSIGEGMCTLDLEGRVVYMNGAAERVLGWSAHDLMGQVLHDRTHFRHADGSPFPIEDCPILRTRRDGEPVRVSDDCFVRRDGSCVPVEYTAAPFETPEGIRGTVLLFSDISERKEREERVQRDLDDLAWVGRINDAIEQDRLVLHAQPIIDLATGTTVQHELLIRMLDTDGSPIPPGLFLPAAERYGLIREIDRWVVRRGTELAAEGHAVELNVSAESLGDPEFATLVERELEESGVDCSLIVIELTETALLRDEAAGRAFIERVQALGCRLALDDFGTGYGGFTYLKRLDVDYLKIDIEFVRDLPRNAASRHVVRAVVNLAQGFGLKTVAEGVEDEETLELLLELGVDYAQGYHIGRPAPAADTLGVAGGA